MVLFFDSKEVLEDKVVILFVWFALAVEALINVLSRAPWVGLVVLFEGVPI